MFKTKNNRFCLTFKSDYSVNLNALSDILDIKTIS